jgi:hypothetical protein
MKNQAEIFQALSNDEKIRFIGWDGDLYYYLVNGQLCNQDNIKRLCTFNIPEQWEIYQESKWYDNIPEGGVLCWVGEGRYLRIITRVLTNTINDYFYRDDGDVGWNSAEPLTCQEVNKIYRNTLAAL